MAGKRGGKPSTIYDIATSAKTSPSTVSLVLNGSWRRYRINSDTAERVIAAAKTVGYNANLRARGLRLSRSSLAGMIIPHYRNRFFAGLAEAFEIQARQRSLCPIVVSTQRDPATERSVVETLVAQQVELLIIAGVTEPNDLDALCAGAGIRCVNLDLPGSGAPSVVSDNRGGSQLLTRQLAEAVRDGGNDPARIRFVGGRVGEFATDERVAGFVDALGEYDIAIDDDAIIRCGYRPEAARDVFERLATAPEGFPPGLFVNSITAFEGFAVFMREHPKAMETVVACFDWDPFAASLPLPVMMMRQDIEGLIEACFEILDGRNVPPGERIVIPPTLAVLPRPAALQWSSAAGPA